MDINTLVNSFNPKELTGLELGHKGLNNKQKLTRALYDFVITLRCIISNPRVVEDITPEIIVDDEFGALPSGRLKELLLRMATMALKH